MNLIEPLTRAEIEQLLNYQNPLTAIGCRNVAMLVLMLDTGLRVSELCGLRFEDTHIEEGYLTVFAGKPSIPHNPCVLSITTLNGNFYPHRLTISHNLAIGNSFIVKP